MAMIKLKNSYFTWDDKFLKKCTRIFNKNLKIEFDRAYGEFNIMKPPTAPRTPKVDKPKNSGMTEGAD